MLFRYLQICLLSSLRFGLICLPLFTFGQKLILGPYLQQAGPDTVVVCWETDKATQACVSGMRGTERFEVLVPEYRKRHEVRVGGLELGAVLNYQIGQTPSKPFAGAKGSYYPMPPTGMPVRVRFAALGDVGTGKPVQAQVAAQLEKARAQDPLDFWIPLGDNAYLLGKDAEYRKHFFPFYKPLMAEVPTLPIPGNHDYYSPNAAPYYNFFVLPTKGESGGTPSGTEAYYSFDYGPVHFVMLNSEVRAWMTDTASPMLRWLNQDLNATRAKWKIVTWHQPPYTKGSHDSDDPKDMNSSLTREVLTPIIERYSVDLVLHGHSHSYERSKLIRGHSGPSNTWNSELMLYDGTLGSPNQPYMKRLPNSPGTVYCVLGNGGKLSPGHPLNHPAMLVSQDTAEGFSLFYISGDTLTARHISRSGALVDAFSIVKPYKVLPNKNAVTDLSAQLNALGQWQINYAQTKAGQPSLQLYDLRARKLFATPRLLKATEGGKFTFSLGNTQVPPGRYLVRTEVNGSVDFFPLELK